MFQLFQKWDLLKLSYYSKAGLPTYVLDFFFNLVELERMQMGWGEFLRGGLVEGRGHSSSCQF